MIIMVVRKAKKLKKYLGTRTRGAGNTENRRGAGSKGGKGNTGKMGHKKHMFFDVIGHNIKNKPLSTSKTITFNQINEIINNMVKKGQKEPFIFDFKSKELKSYTKLVSKGTLKYKLNCKNIIITEKAKSQIENKGGSIE